MVVLIGLRSSMNLLLSVFVSLLSSMWKYAVQVF